MATPKVGGKAKAEAFAAPFVRLWSKARSVRTRTRSQTHGSHSVDDGALSQSTPSSTFPERGAAPCGVDRRKYELNCPSALFIRSLTSLELCFSQVCTLATVDRRVAHSLQLTCKHLKALTTPQLYRVVVLLNCKILRSFFQAICLNPALALHVQHLWIGPRDLEHGPFFFPEDRNGTLCLNPGTFELTVTQARSVLSVTHNLLSLALPARFFSDVMHRTSYKFRLVEFVSSGAHSCGNARDFESLRHIRRMYVLSGSGMERGVGNAICGLPHIEVLELCWSRPPIPLRSIQGMIFYFLAPTSPIKRLTFVACGAFVDEMRDMLPCDDSRVSSRNAAPSFKQGDGGFVMAEWKARATGHSQGDFWKPACLAPESCP
ncbi:hypothetical protein BOTBODRAFT_169283 [Botryobasidium botryosum FD-172 SS1]|uniref:Uncharacterized protein n=1 Tax=Botryobasidium botryosum (strain FD-172 SS1) TaxID=930990 RepID=A0A067N9S7_BOTB1|nr:hypothetical protein BOTBODRAFT_169283 [Botryobasidium botryosum FD-172 SS1]